MLIDIQPFLHKLERLKVYMSYAAQPMIINFNAIQEQQFTYEDLMGAYHKYGVLLCRPGHEPAIKKLSFDEWYKIDNQ